MESGLNIQTVCLIAEIESHTELKSKPGVYFLRCAICEHPLYIGGTDDLFGRVRTHTFFPPYGAVDIVIGEMLDTKGKKKWDTLCSHLKEVKNRPRSEIGSIITLNVMRIQERGARITAETRLFAIYPQAFGNFEKTWANNKEIDIVEYKRRKKR